MLECAQVPYNGMNDVCKEETPEKRYELLYVVCMLV